MTSEQETPPLTWGRLLDWQKCKRCGGNTPTHVGKTSSLSLSFVFLRKHPHSRGEDGVKTMTDYVEIETPPLTWGRRTGNAEASFGARNTPTHVGKTRLCSHSQGVNEKHPHSRGEDVVPSRSCSTGWETPPLTWGRHISCQVKFS